MSVAPAYSFQKWKPNNLRPRSSKLSRFDVAEIREWARSAGYGMTVAQQVAIMQESYPMLAASTLREVLTNQSWFDPEYDPNVPLVPVQAATVSWLAQWWCLLLLILSPEDARATVSTRPTNHVG